MDFGKELDINRFLIEAKVPRAKIEQVRLAIVEKASENALIKRLVNAVIFAWSEYGSNSCSVLALGVYDWKSVCIMLDTNVAIPYLLISYFAPTKDRFSNAVNAIISVLKDRGCKIVIQQMFVLHSIHCLKGIQIFHQHNSFQLKQMFLFLCLI